MVFDNELLINLVRARPALWNPTDESYKDRELNKRLWKEICDAVGAEDYITRYKWQCLRDCFRKQVKREDDLRNNTPNDKFVSQWQYMNDMMFLRPYLKLSKNKCVDNSLEEIDLSSIENFYQQMQESSAQRSLAEGDSSTAYTEIPRAKCRMNINLLINSVKERPSLWDPTNDFYTEWQLAQKLWKEVAEAVGVEVEIACRKWRALVESFRREIKKVNNPTLHASNDKYVSKWKYLNGMMFLYPHLERYNTIDYNPSINHQSTQDFSDESQELLDSSSVEDARLTPIGSNNVIIEKPLNNEQSSQKNKVENDDYHFAMSIIPSMKLLPQHRKLYLRTKIQELLYNEHANQKTQSLTY